MNEYVTAQNTVTRKVGVYKRHVVAKSRLLEIVPANTKSYVPLTELVAEKIIQQPVHQTPEIEEETETEDVD